jgi:GTP cyclohydrolase I
LTIGTGHASVYYLPSDRVVGLGAITDLVQAFTHRLVLQEEAGERVAESLVAHLGARGAACVLTFRHGCMELHGQKKRARVRTVSMKGSFANKGADRSLVLAAIRSAR